jgi:hypothetical protein
MLMNIKSMNEEESENLKAFARGQGGVPTLSTFSSSPQWTRALYNCWCFGIGATILIPH